MANFDPAYKITSKNEGGYANDPDDRGGETYKGIARNYWPDWAGWKIIDQIPMPSKYHGAFFDDPELDSLVKQFYLQHKWKAYYLDKINSQAVANFVYDFVVQSGQAVREIQKVLAKLKAVDVDGIIGSQTINAINSIDDSILLPALVEARTQYYQSGVIKGWLDEKFLPGVLDRVARYLPSKKFQASSRA